MQVDLDRYIGSASPIDVSVPMDFVYLKMLSSEIEMTVLYPAETLQMLSSGTIGYVVEEIDNEVGVARLKITNTALNSYRL